MESKRIPILFINNGKEGPLSLCLLQSLNNNSNTLIYVLTDSDPTKFPPVKNFQYISLHDFFVGATEFVKLYKHMSPKPMAHELFRLQRWFVLKEFMEFFQIPVVFFCESTVLLYDDVSRLYEKNWQDKTVLCVNEKNVNTSSGYWQYEDVCRFCDLIVEEYRDNLDTLQRVFGHMAQLGGFSGDNDCLLLWKFFHQSNFKDSLTDIVDGVTFDYDISRADNRAENEFEIDSGVKKIEWRTQKPFAVNIITNSEVRFAALHFSESVKELLPKYCTVNDEENQKTSSFHNKEALADYFRQQKNPRHWWFQMNETGTYMPPIYSVLNANERQILKEWFDATDQIYSKLDRGSEESGIPVLSFLQGLITGNNISKIVECGTNYGYATLLIGIMQRNMKNKNSLFTVDIERFKTEFAQSWVTRAALGDQVKLFTGDSASRETTQEAMDFLGGELELVFIDSSHVYSHTVRELETWYPLLKPGGFIVLHDANFYYHQQVMKGMPHSGGGVFRALCEWREIRRVPVMMLNNFLGPVDKEPDITKLIYKDISGLGLIQKQW